MPDVILKTKRTTCSEIINNSPKLLNSEFNLSLGKAKDFFCSKTKFKRYKKGHKFDISSWGSIFLITNGEIHIFYNGSKIIKKLKTGDFFAIRKDFSTIHLLVNKNIDVFSLERQYVNSLFKLSPETRDLILDFFVDIKRKLNNNHFTRSH